VGWNPNRDPGNGSKLMDLGPPNKNNTPVWGWAALGISAGSFIWFLVGVNVLGVIRVDIITGWDWLNLFMQLCAILIGFRSWAFQVGQGAIVLATLLFGLEAFRIGMIIGDPGIR
jgi:hypothetical protein